MMKTEKKKIEIVRDLLPYQSPRITVQEIEMEYSIAAGSMQSNSITESWENETQTQDAEW